MGFEEDPYVKDYCKRKSDLSQDTINKYKFVLKQFSDVNGESIENIINNCLKDQESRIEGNRIIEFSPNSPSSCVNKYLNNFEDYFLEKGNSQATINDKIKSIRTFLRFYDVKLPNWSKKRDDRKKWYPLSKEDLKFIIGISENLDKAIFTFMLSSGVRRLDVINFTIGDFMEATKEYHDFVDVDEFIDNAPEDMIGYWDFIPHKNKRLEIPCKTFNSRESSNLILQHLRRVKNVYMPRKNEKDGLNLKLEKSDALFGSREKHYKGHLSKSGLSQKVESKYSQFKEWKIKQIDDEIKENKIAQEDRDKEIDKITKLSCHDFRKYFINTIDSYSQLSSERSKLIMEGHKSKIPTDPNYIAKEKEELKEGYENALPYLTIMDNVNVKLEKETLALKEQITELKEQLKAKDEQFAESEQLHQAKIEEIKKEFEKQAKENEEFKKEIKETMQNIPYDHLRSPISFTKVPSSREGLNCITIINFIFDCLDKKENLTALDKKLQSFTNEEMGAIKEIVCEMSLSDKRFKETGEIKQLVQKAITKITRNPQLLKDKMQYIEEQYLGAEKRKKYKKLLRDELESIGVFEEEELEEACNEISSAFSEKMDKILLDEITSELVSADIEEFL